MSHIPLEFVAYLEEMRALRTDGQGCRVLPGLTHEETIEIYRLLDVEVEDARFVELRDKHERGLLAIRFAENEARLHREAGGLSH